MERFPYSATHAEGIVDIVLSFYQKAVKFLSLQPLLFLSLNKFIY